MSTGVSVSQLFALFIRIIQPDLTSKSSESAWHRLFAFFFPSCIYEFTLSDVGESSRQRTQIKRKEKEREKEKRKRCSLCLIHLRFEEETRKHMKRLLSSTVSREMTVALSIK